MKLVRTTGGLLEASSTTLSAAQVQRALELAKKMLRDNPDLKEQVDEAAMDRFAAKVTEPAPGAAFVTGALPSLVQRFNAK